MAPTPDFGDLFKFNETKEYFKTVGEDFKDIFSRDVAPPPAAIYLTKPYVVITADTAEIVGAEREESLLAIGTPSDLSIVKYIQDVIAGAQDERIRVVINDVINDGTEVAVEQVPERHTCGGNSKAAIAKRAACSVNEDLDGTDDKGYWYSWVATWILTPPIFIPIRLAVEGIIHSSNATAANETHPIFGKKGGDDSE